MDLRRENGTTSEARVPAPASGRGRIVLNFFYEGGVHVAELSDGAGLVVGRASSADVKLAEYSLSRHHARFSRVGIEVWVEDLGSRNGVMHCAERVQRVPLAHGSVVRLGNVTAVVQSLAANPGDGRPCVADGVGWPEPPIAHSASNEAFFPVLRSAPMRALDQSVRRVSVTDVPVLIVGETGVGKELVAEAIHRASHRRGGAFCPINCGAIPDSLLTSLLFGHEKGAFTGATQKQKGLFEQARGGTVFLDEVGELSPSTQAALLRVLETKRVTRLGSQTELALDTRVIAATHRDLEGMARDGTFRTDLLFRLNAFVLSVPPLRERREEIWPLAQHFLRTASEKFSLPAKSLDEPVRTALEAYAWPGNVRELRNVIEHALVMSEGMFICDSELPERVRAGGHSWPPDEALNPSNALSDDAAVGLADSGYRSQVRDYEVALIIDGLRKANGNQTVAAQLLKLPLRTLVHKMKTYGIRRTLAE